MAMEGGGAGAESNYNSSTESRREQSPPPKSPTPTTAQDNVVLEFWGGMVDPFPFQNSNNLKFPTPTDHEEKATYVKFLLSNAEAGSIIGKGGSTITDFQARTGARIQLSRNYEVFPGTPDRIVMVSGFLDDILKAVDLILGKLLDEGRVGPLGPKGHCTQPYLAEFHFCKMLFPQQILCSPLIVEMILSHYTLVFFFLEQILCISNNLTYLAELKLERSFIEDSRAGIKISPQDYNFPGLHDRLVTVTGTLEEQMRAIELILFKLAEDHNYVQSMNAPFQYAAVYVGMNYGPPHRVGGRYPNYRQQNKVHSHPTKDIIPKVAPQEDRDNSITIGVADERVGLVLGRNGRSIMEISQLSGARVKISDRGDFLPGTCDRKVTITGSQRAIRMAESMISQKVASISER
ncbi:putative histone H2B.1-like [Capsicum annuum]|nr:putative histone H2B.1-like [Capsicum annuum]